MRASSSSLSLGKQLHAALRRSLEAARDETIKVMRFEALESRSELSKHALPLYSFSSPPPSSTGSPAATVSNASSNVVLPLNQDFATGSDIDIGGLSTVRFGWDPSERAARFYGTLSSDIPRGAKIERSGYAAFRNKNRPTLFGTQTWDTSMHPYLAIKIRNRLGQQKGGQPDQSQQSQVPSSSSLRAAADAAFERVQSSASDPSAILAHAVHALGLDLASQARPGPKFFVNIQTDGPVTSDLFQHRLLLDPNKLDEWQTVLIPFDSFVLTNTGVVSMSPLTMLREKVRTIGISAVIDAPAIPPSASGGLAAASTRSSSGSRASVASTADASAGPSALRRRSGEGVGEEDDWAADGNLRQVDTAETEQQQEQSLKANTPVRGSKRSRAFPFDLAIEKVYAVADPDEVD
ncbi:hypothetical protein OC846_002375 [Tilletia horrida]|uniref:NADH:ubiquinone oxidoreductase intermediate-associated protein 30 domain-containing protein n=1 Tax=Tilletia horrida TaxID=155126 RepID=A0AAN6GR97_9BASI|nr:hypothetical protein OC845_002612 [Tilletia horrida]KAK0553718.1 hypothetical protein OC846_002375 [Tilletia horrida]KAK0567656.1 hypothetical protein OC861_002612 [Tilletia horrida]